MGEYCEICSRLTKLIPLSLNERTYQTKTSHLSITVYCCNYLYVLYFVASDHNINLSTFISLLVCKSHIKWFIPSTSHVSNALLSGNGFYSLKWRASMATCSSLLLLVNWLLREILPRRLKTFFFQFLTGCNRMASLLPALIIRPWLCFSRQRSTSPLMPTFLIQSFLCHAGR